MKILERLSNRPPRGDAGDPGPTEASSPDEDQLPITNYDKLDAKQLRAQLSPLSQVDLAAIESYELSHKARSVVLNRLHWLKGSEPVQATTLSGPRRSCEGWPRPTQKRSRPCATTNGATKIAT